MEAQLRLPVCVLHEGAEVEEQVEVEVQQSDEVVADDELENDHRDHVDL